ncbi:carboxypeptidase M32 [Shewanella sedimentimangrovi]|uniref:Metal-dependent carboxypeptidase n=1 Tax=Shewanella sedimentimangrovi TaxID=2814293 RepID=A0ABX7QYW2_9GAMM|nr:carboxypeptidase M32 [Shewanella sedimentimangrovi]QSX36424.1 carboxypeptidase M32 [Shewanella sedimentimangrovi]
MSASAYDGLCRHFQQIAHFEHFSALGDWDQATMMPVGGGEARSEAMATLAGHIHALKTAPWLAEALDKARAEAQNDDERANLREMAHQYRQATAVPQSLVEAKTLAGYRCENAWREQRRANDWQGFKPKLEEVIRLTREEAQCRSQALGMTPYDTLLDKFEPGVTQAMLDNTFGELKNWLPELIAEVTDLQLGQAVPQLSGHYPIPAQEALGREVMTLLGFDFNQGRLDVSNHPFCGGVPGDVRLTTRYDSNNFSSALMGVIHETGHARYEQGLPKAWRGQPGGLARSMGLHESQSLFFEMQLAGSEAFLGLLSPLINRHLGLQLSAEGLARIYSRVNPGLIRVDADEVTYPCHILLRYEAEKAMVNGSLEVADLPDFWSTQMQTLLGINTDGNYRDGCMQDIHWTLGELGYFPSYTLGAMVASQLRYALEAELDSSLDSLLEQGRLADVFAWLERNIWSRGSLLQTDDLIQAATGKPLSGRYLERHLRSRYLGE